MQSQEDDLGVRRQFPASFLGVQFVDRVAEGSKRVGHRRAGAQRYLSFGRGAAQHDRHVLAFDCSLADNLHFFAQLNASLRLGARFDKIDQFQHVPRRSRAFIDDEVSMHLGNSRLAAARAFEAEFVDQFSGGDGGGWVFKDANRRSIPWLRFPSAFG